MIEVISAEPIGDYKLKVALSNGKEGVFDTSPYLNTDFFSELRAPAYFRRVRVAFGCVVWPKEQDFSADTIEYGLQSGT